MPGAESYEVEPQNKYFEAIRAIADFELRPGPSVSFLNEIDLTQLERVRAAAVGVKPSYTALVAKAVALALREFPYANRRVHRSPGSRSFTAPTSPSRASAICLAPSRSPSSTCSARLISCRSLS